MNRGVRVCVCVCLRGRESVGLSQCVFSSSEGLSGKESGAGDGGRDEEMKVRMEIHPIKN